MEVFGCGNKIEIADGKAGYAVVKLEKQSLLVHCLVISQKTINYADTVGVMQSCSRLIDELKRKVSFEELMNHLTKEYGENKVFEYIK